jgi:hypothetical protein
METRAVAAAAVLVDLICSTSQAKKPVVVVVAYEYVAWGSSGMHAPPDIK